MGQRLKVLIVEDSEDDMLLLVRELRSNGWDVEYKGVDNATDMTRCLEEETWDIIISDYAMPGFSGLDALHIAADKCVDVPFVILSGTIGEQTAVETMRAGAHDYIMKGHLALLGPAVRRELREAEIRREHRRVEQCFRIVSKVATDIIYEWDLRDGRITWFGPIEEALGYEAADMPRTSSDWLELIHPDDRLHLKDITEYRQEEPLCQEIRVRKKDGTWLYWADRGAPVLDDHGRAVKWIGGYSDITERKRSESQLVEYQRRLKSLASELSLVEERERRRIAVGVHDDICQKLALAKLELQSLQHSLEDTTAIKVLERVCGITDLIISDAHSLTFELSNPVLYEIGLDAAIESWLGANVKDKQAIDCRFHSAVRGIKPPEDVRVFLFQSVRELVTNVLKHANASTLDISIGRDNDKLSISVKDNGDGFDRTKVETKETGGFGLFSVEERLAYLGGSLDVESRPGQGTTIVLRVPWHQECQVEVKG